jgi:hypothetical protein
MSGPQNRFGFVLPGMPRFREVGAKSGILAQERHARRTTPEVVSKAFLDDGTLRTIHEIDTFDSLNAPRHDAVPQSVRIPIKIRGRSPKSPNF